jgi:hypothetical protein
MPRVALEGSRFENRMQAVRNDMADRLHLIRNADEVKYFLINHNVGVKPETIQIDMDHITHLLQVTFDLWTDREWESMGRRNKMIGGLCWDDQD